jgi:ADP-heptose:LPS heptosyltransferase
LHSDNALEFITVPLDGSPRFLITRLSALGDCVHTLPLAAALRRHHPDAYIAWVAEAHVAPLLANHPAIDEVISLPRRWAKSLSTILGVRRRLQALDFAVAIDPQSLTKSAALAWASNAPMRIGFAGEFGREISQFLNNVLVPSRPVHAVDRYLTLLRPLGIERPEVRFDIPALGKIHSLGQPGLCDSRELGIQALARCTLRRTGS